MDCCCIGHVWRSESVTPSWSDLLYRVGWLLYDRFRMARKRVRRWRVERRQARRSPFARHPGEPIMITSAQMGGVLSGCYTRMDTVAMTPARLVHQWGGNQLYINSEVSPVPQRLARGRKQLEARAAKGEFLNARGERLDPKNVWVPPT